jgi:hypothetical protein
MMTSHLKVPKSENVGMSNRVFAIILTAMFCLGFIVGLQMSGLSRLQSSKLLNLAGLAYTLLGVLVLSEVLATDTWKAFCVRWLAPTILWFHTVVPLGAFLSSLAGMAMHKPSSSTVGRFSASFLSYSMIPLLFFNEVIVFPQLRFIQKDVDVRWRWLGFFLVLSGVGLQLIAAVIDLG